METVVHNLTATGEVGEVAERDGVKRIRKFNRKPRSTQSTVSAEEVKKITEEITQLTKEWSKVHITKDFDHLRRIWADDFSYTDNDGKVDKREDLISSGTGPGVRIKWSVNLRAANKSSDRRESSQFPSINST